jgi:cytoskeleton protein RodZ
MGGSTRAKALGSFGEQLRQAREARHITLQEIASSTKISSRALQALESEHFDQLPGGIFNKGFVRAYARYVGLDEEKTLAAYLAVAKTEGSETDMQTISSQLAAARPGALESMMNGTTLAGVLALIVALGLGAVWLKEHRQEAREQAAAASQTAGPAAGAVAPVAVSPAPVVVPAEPGATAGAGVNPPNGAGFNARPGGQGSATSDAGNAGLKAAPLSNLAANQNSALHGNQNGNPAASSNQAASVVSGGGAQSANQAALAAPVEVSIAATQRAWISVLSDGKKVESLTLDPDKPEMRSRSYKAREKLVLVVGNLGGLTVTYNGKPAGTLGAAGQTATLTFTPQGIRKF